MENFLYHSLVLNALNGLMSVQGSDLRFIDQPGKTRYEQVAAEAVKYADATMSLLKKNEIDREEMAKKQE